jgi:hypothetical protein
MAAVHPGRHRGNVTSKLRKRGSEVTSHVDIDPESDPESGMDECVSGGCVDWASSLLKIYMYDSNNSNDII